MSDLVVDSSVVAKWVLPEPDSSVAQRLISEIAGIGNRLIVVDLVFPEVANAIWKQHRRHLISLDEARGFLAALRTIPVHIEAATRLLDPAFEIAVKYDRAVYDALFVALSRDLRLPGITADNSLVTGVQRDFPEIMHLRDWP
jgi:predicted nucleic acid-binding protein